MRMRRNQDLQPSPWDNQVHLVHKLTLASALADQLETRVGKTYLLHHCSTSDAVAEGIIAGAL
jgi:hypothetical protein